MSFIKRVESKHFFQIFVTAQSYEHDIWIKGIPAFMSDNTLCYELDLGHRSLNILETKTVTLINTSKFHHYKFEISSINYLEILPKVGHLKAQTSKDIVAAFRSKEPLQIKNVSIYALFIFIFNQICYRRN